MKKLATKQYKGNPQQRPPQPMKTSGEISALGNTAPEPMELGVACRRTLMKEEYQKLRSENACFYCWRPNIGHMAWDWPLKKKRPGNGGSH